MTSSLTGCASTFRMCFFSEMSVCKHFCCIFFWSYRSRSRCAHFDRRHLLRRTLTLSGPALMNRSSSAGAAGPSVQPGPIPQVAPSPRLPGPRFPRVGCASELTSFSLRWGLNPSQIQAHDHIYIIGTREALMPCLMSLDVPCS